MELESFVSRECAIQDQWIDVNGARVHYLRAGSGPALLLIHGIVGSCGNWRSNIDALAQHATVYAIDFLNMGESERLPSLDVSLEATADRLGAIMDALGLDHADIAAHSHGGAVALTFAGQCPERVRSLLLFAPANPYSRSADWMVRFHSSPVGDVLAPIYPHMPRWMQQIALRRMYGDPRRIAPDCLDEYVCGLRVRGTIPHIIGIVRRWTSDMRRLEAALPHAGSIPTLLVWGDRDRAVSVDSGFQLQKILKRSRLQVVKGAGHIVFQERADVANALMVEWLTGAMSVDAEAVELSPAPSRRMSPRPTRESLPA